MNSRILHAMAIAFLPGMFSYKMPRKKPTRPCLNCGEDKQHNNSFCSADCYKEYREKKAEKGSKVYG